MTNSLNPQDISVDLEFTPNPNTLKYVTSVALLLTGAANFPSRATAEGKSDLAIALYDLGTISAVMVGRNFVTVTLVDQDSLTDLNEKIIDTIKNFLIAGKTPVRLEALESATDTSSLSEDEQKIVKILDEEIRPAVAMDGGDIVFEKFEDGVVYLHMRGSCSGCPSSTATLKMGIENRLKDAVSAVREVVSI